MKIYFLYDIILKGEFMSQEEFGKLIKKIRQENNLTQKDLAEKYNVTYQAVSKWENGKNMPDIALIKQISEDFNISITEMIGGIENKKDNKSLILIIVALIFILILIIVFLLTRNDGFKFKTISSNCEDFTITGSMSYDDKKSVIYISNITYCGEKEDTVYESISCSLFDKQNNNIKEIDKCKEEKNITLDEFLKDTTFHLDNTQNSCSTYSEDNLYLEIYATSKEGKTTLHEIPLKVSDMCE